nr:uncharacterized protein LOC113696531 [Coffea arabica]
MINWPKPASVKQLKGFLGLTGYYRKFVRGYVAIAKPLTELLKKDGLEKKPLAYLSKALGPRHLGMSIYEKELLAIVTTISKWRHYLEGHHFVLKTDHQNDIKKEVQECEVCSRCKHENIPNLGLRQSLPGPQYSWSHITMDFIEGLSMFKGKNVIMVVVDRLTKYSHFLGLSHPICATAIEDYVQNKQAIAKLLKENLEQAQARMMHYADTKRPKRTIETTVAIRRNMKLATKYYSPYQVVEKIGAVAYKLKLPKGFKIHLVFHVSLLKKKVGEGVTPGSALPYSDEEGQLKVQQVAMLERRMVKRKNSAAVQWLVQWFNSTPTNATWEDDEFI